MAEVQPESRRLGQVYAFVSAKGGTGKTLLAATASYILRRAGKRVVSIDADFSTRGLSLYLLGKVLHSADLDMDVKNALADAILEDVCPAEVSPRVIVDDEVTYEVIVSNREMWRGGVPDDRFLGAGGDTELPGVRRLDRYLAFLRDLCEVLRARYDYVIVDTRGGYDFTSAAPAAVADGYVIVLEADSLSIDQVSGFTKRIQDFGHEHGIQPRLKGFIINKALFPVDSDVLPQALHRLYGAKTFAVIPADRDAIKAYQDREIPSETVPDSDFAYYSLRAVEHMVGPSVNWTPAEADGFEQIARSIRIAWAARRRLDLMLRSLPVLHLGLLAVAVICYALYKLDAGRLALPGFYAAMAATVLGTAFASLLSGFRWLAVGSRRGPLPLRLSLGAACLVFWMVLFYLAVADVPRTFSRSVLLARILRQDALIGSTTRELEVAQRELRDVQTELDFVTKDRLRENAAASRVAHQCATVRLEREELDARVRRLEGENETLQLRVSELNQRSRKLTSDGKDPPAK